MKNVKFKIRWCELCKTHYVECPYCGNNCCNAMTGKLEDGTECGCKEAYEFQEELDRNKIWINN